MNKGKRVLQIISATILVCYCGFQVVMIASKLLDNTAFLSEETTNNYITNLCIYGVILLIACLEYLPIRIKKYFKRKNRFQYSVVWNKNIKCYAKKYYRNKTFVSTLLLIACLVRLGISLFSIISMAIRLDMTINAVYWFEWGVFTSCSILLIIALCLKHKHNTEEIEKLKLTFEK